MATAPHAVTTEPTPVVEAARRGRKPRDPNAVRGPAKPKVIYAIVQVLGADKQPLAIPKGDVHVISFEKSAAEVLEKIESGAYPNALYLRGMLPAGR